MRAGDWSDGRRSTTSGPSRARDGYYRTMVTVQLERIEALELLGLTLAHLTVAEARADLSPRIPLLMTIRDKIAVALREDT